jgi:hypothetical protein
VLFNFLEDLRKEAGNILPKLKSYSKFDYYRKDQVVGWLCHDPSFTISLSEHVLMCFNRHQ